MLKIKKKSGALAVRSNRITLRGEAGPFYDMLRDGVTQSLIAMWLTCRQKARLYLEGWDSRYHSPALTYGSIGHAALEHAYKAIQNGDMTCSPTPRHSGLIMDKVEKQWLAENVKPNKEALQYMETSLALVEITLPRYFDYWKKDFKGMQWLGLEENFKVMCPIAPDGKLINVPVRGKRDGRFRIKGGLWLFETKFKSMISEGDIVDSLAIDFQVMLYIWAMYEETKRGETPKGVLYNIVRRTALKQRVDESLVSFVKRVAADMDKRPDFYFMRMESAVTQGDIVKFEWDLMGIVKEIYLWWRGEAAHYKNTYSCIGKYGRCSFLPVCTGPDYSSLVKRKTVFKELEDF